MLKYREDFLFMEECFSNIIQKKEIDNNLNIIHRIIKRRFDLDIKISIIENNNKPFFGMSIYPQQSTVDKLVDAIYNKKSTSVIEELWKKNESWFLEIDSNLLYDKNLNANPKEIVAVLLHEIGHTIYSNSIPYRVNKILRFKLAEMEYGSKGLLKSKKIRSLLGITFIEACSISHYNQKKETDADKFVAKMGYAKPLYDFLNKLLLAHGSSAVDIDDKYIDKEIQIIADWTIENIGELKYRTTKLKTFMKTEVLSNPSRYTRDFFDKIKKSFFGEENDFRSLVNESYLKKEYDRILLEGNVSILDRIGRVKKVRECDIDILYVQAEKIESTSDKIYLLDLIYDQLEIVDKALNYIEIGETQKVQQSKTKLLGFQKSLHTLRQKVLSTPIEETRYGLFIKYPKGYEG